MGFVRKYFAWVVIGVVLLVEAGAMFVVGGKRGEAEAKGDDLAKKQTLRDQLKQQAEGAPKRIEVHKKRREIATRELGDCLLFFWHRGEAIEGLFESPLLDAYEVNAWQAPPKMDVFGADFQAVYNAEVAKLATLMAAVGASRADLGLADGAAFKQPNVTIGDVYASAKELKLKRELLTIFAQGKTRIDHITFGSKVRTGPVLPHGAVRTTSGLFEPIPVELGVVTEYPKLTGEGGFLEALLASPLCFRILAIQSIKRGSGAAVAAAAPAAGGAPAPVEREVQSVVAVITGEIPDFNVDIASVTFPRKDFPNRAAVLGWLDKEDKRLNDIREGCESAIKSGHSPTWAVEAIAAIDTAVSQAAPGDAVAVTVADKLDPPPREYDFADATDARRWLGWRYAFEKERVEAQRALWARVRRAIEKGRADEKNAAGLAVPFRPANQFDRNNMWNVAVDPQGQVQVQLGLVTFKPVESPGGVKRATAP